MKHTKEPWVTENELIDSAEGYAVARCHWGNGDQGEEDAKRIVACVNACVGMENPVEEIAELRKQLVWHDATKETPEESGRYLIAYKQGNVVREFVSNYGIHDGWLSMLGNIEIIRWLPIPKQTTDD